MTNNEIYYLIGGLIGGLFVGWLFWRFRTLSRDQASALESRSNSAERRLGRTANELTESEASVAGLESQLADERKIFEHALVGELVTDQDSVSIAKADGSNGAPEADESASQDSVVLADRLAQSQTWLDEAHQRIEALENEADQGRSDQDQLLGRVETSEAKLDQTRRALVEADSQVNTLTSRATASENALTSARLSIKKIRRHVKSANSAVTQGLADPVVIDLRDHSDAEPTEIDVLVEAGLIEGGEGSMLALADANGRLLELESELSAAHIELDSVADAPQRAMELTSEVELLKSQIDDQQKLTRELELHIGKREEIDQRLDTMFVEIHELRGRSAAVRSELYSGEV